MESTFPGFEEFDKTRVELQELYHQLALWARQLGRVDHFFRIAAIGVATKAEARQGLQDLFREFSTSTEVFSPFFFISLTSRARRTRKAAC